MADITRIQTGEASLEEARETLVRLISSEREFDLKLAYIAVRAWTWKALNEGRRDAPEMRGWHQLMTTFSSYLGDCNPGYAARFGTLADLVHDSILAD